MARGFYAYNIALKQDTNDDEISFYKKTTVSYQTMNLIKLSFYR